MNRRKVLAIAWPIILSNLSTPLLGLVDTAVIGNLGDASLIGGIALGTMIFSFLFWGFGFLRMGTTGLVAQAAGAENWLESQACFYRALLIGGAIGSLLILLQSPIASLSMSLIGGSAEVESAALTYFQIRIWGSPLNLTLLAMMGYFLGIQDARSVLKVQLTLNGTNIVLDLLLVVGLGWGVAGAALATVMAEAIACLLSLAIIFPGLKRRTGSLIISRNLLLARNELLRMFAVNRDIMIRTICLIFGFAWFTNQGAKSGDLILAANTILMQFVSFSAFFLDGFALAAESLVGHATGQRERNRLTKVIRLSVELGLYTAGLITLIFILAGSWVISMLTNVPEVNQVADEYFLWVLAAPIVSLWCYLLDGIFIGATRTVEMRNAMLISLGVYLGSWYLLQGWDNHGLWAALMVYFVARAFTLGLYLPRVSRWGES